MSLLADLAYAFKWQPSELEALTIDEVLMWHAEIGRIGRELNNAP